MAGRGLCYFPGCHDRWCKSSNEKISLMNTMARKFPTSSLVGDANMEIANAYLADERFREAIPPLNNVLKLAQIIV